MLRARKEYCTNYQLSLHRKLFNGIGESGVLGLLLFLTLWGRDCLVFVFDEMIARKEFFKS